MYNTVIFQATYTTSLVEFIVINFDVEIRIIVIGILFYVVTFKEILDLKNCFLHLLNGINLNYYFPSL